MPAPVPPSVAAGRANINNFLNLMKRKNILATFVLAAAAVTAYGQPAGEVVKGKALPFNTSNTDIVSL